MVALRLGGCVRVGCEGWGWRVGDGIPGGKVGVVFEKREEGGKRGGKGRTRVGL